MFQLERAIADWTGSLRLKGMFSSARLAELEDHLRCEIEKQISNGKSAEHAFRDAAGQLGDVRQLATAYAVNAGWFRKLWQQLKQEYFTAGGTMRQRTKSIIVILNAMFFASVILLSKWYWMNDGFTDTTAFLIIAVWFATHLAISDPKSTSLRSEIRCLRNKLVSNRSS